MRVRSTAVALGAALVASACAYNTNDHEVAHRAVVEAAAAHHGGGIAPSAPGVAAPADRGGPAAAPSAGTRPDPGARPGPGTTAAATEGPAVGDEPEDDAAAAPPATSDPDAGGPPTAPAGEQPPSGDTRAAPPGGNGGATDVGVTEDAITISNAADRTGAIPGLFQDAQEAVQARLLKFQAEEGTVHGRTIELVPQDSKLSNQGNRTAYLEACEFAFAAVGSMSAFEQGAVDPVRECGLPDLRTTAVSPDLAVLPSVQSMVGQTPGVAKVAHWEYIAEHWPDAIQHAAYAFIDNATTRYQSDLNRRATEEAFGYAWDLYPIALSEVNYASYVQQFKDSGARVVAFQGAYQQAVRLASAMQQQNFTPDVYFLQANAYTRGLIEEGGEVMEGYTILGQTGSLLEEIDGNPEMQEYAAWLGRVNPRARPTGLGMYAWGAASLFIESVKAVGPNLTRQALLDHIDATYSAYTAGDLYPAEDVAGQSVSDCVIMLDVTASGFVRRAPAEGYLCSSVGPVTVG